MIILVPLIMSLIGIVLATDYRGWRDAAAKAHEGVWNVDYFKTYATFRYVGLMTAWMGAIFTVGPPSQSSSPTRGRSEPVTGPPVSWSRLRRPALCSQGVTHE